MGILDKFFGTKKVKKERKRMAKEFKVNGNMLIGTFKRKFHEEFGVHMKVYTNAGGKKQADDKIKISQLETYKSGDVSVHGANKIGKIEKEFWDEMGLKINILDPGKEDKGWFADNNESLASVKR